jgi:tetratricopeptide (TPR) repeat protein
MKELIPSTVSEVTSNTGYELPDLEVANKRLKTLDSEGCARLGEEYRQAGNYYDAIRCFSMAIEKNPDNHWAYAHRGAARGTMRDLTGAISDFAIARQLKGGTYPWVDAQEGETYRLYAWHNMAVLNHTVLWEVIEKSLRLLDRSLLGLPESAWAYAHRGATYTLAYWIASVSAAPGINTEELIANAEKDLKRACELHNGYSWAWAFRALALTLQNKLDQAQLIMEEVPMEDPEWKLRVFKPLAELYGYQKLHYQAIVAGWDALRIQAEDFVAQYHIAEGMVRLATAPWEKEIAHAFLQQTRITLMNLKSRLVAMLGGVDLMEGKKEDALKALLELQEHADVEAIGVVARDRAWKEVANDPAFKALIKQVIGQGNY